MADEVEGRAVRGPKGGARAAEGDKTELRRGRTGRPQLVKKAGRFTAARQEAFFATLADTCNVTRAIRAAGVSRRTVYAHRIKHAAFRARWAEVLRESYARLELMMLERAINGTVKTSPAPTDRRRRSTNIRTRSRFTCCGSTATPPPRRRPSTNRRTSRRCASASHARSSGCASGVGNEEAPATDDIARAVSGAEGGARQAGSGDGRMVIALMTPADLLLFDACFEAWVHEGQLPPRTRAGGPG